MELVIWKYSDEAGACALMEPTGIESTLPLRNGMPLSAGLTEPLISAMNPDFPADIRLLDNVCNTDGILIVSGRLHGFLEAKGLVDVEYLPLQILDHKRRIIATDYVVVHPLNPIDAIDIEASGCRMSRIKKDRIQSMDRLVLRQGVVSPERKLFRLKGLWGVTLIERELAESITAAGFSGVDWVEILAYPGI